MQQKNNIGWGAVFLSYKGKDTFKDCLIPIIFSLAILVIILIFSFDTFSVLNKVVDISLNILPAVVSLLLAAYAIVLTLFWSEYGKRIRKYENGKQLLTNLNSSFAAIILYMIIGLLIDLALHIIISMEIELSSIFFANLFNLISVFIVVLVLSFSIYSLKDITINIFNLGQITPLFDDIENKKDEENKDKMS